MVMVIFTILAGLSVTPGVSVVVVLICLHTMGGAEASLDVDVDARGTSSSLFVSKAPARAKSVSKDGRRDNEIGKGMHI